MIRLGFLLIVFFFSFQSQASRLVEIEDYYSKKATEFIKMRYPNRPFTVYIKADAGENEIKARGSVNNEREVLSLPYLDVVDAKTGEFWLRTDLSLGTLISYLKSVYVKVDIDVDFDTNEREAFQDQLFKFLKLSPVYDRIEVTKMKWSTLQEVRDQRLWIGGALLAPLVLFLMFFILSKLSVRSLVKGLSEPLSEIGKSTENFAHQTATMSQGQRSSQQNQDSPPLMEGGRKVALEIIENNKNFFHNPDGLTMNFLEDWGEKDPQAMGAIFNELETEDVKELFSWGVGEWWYAALTHPGALNSSSLQILGRVHSLRMRKNLEKNQDIQLAGRKELALALSRLSVKELGQILQGHSFEDVKGSLQLVPRERMINVCKYLFPGEWASLMEENSDKGSLSQELSDALYKKALEVRPLRGHEEVSQFFVEADLLKYLDQASTKDEREVYRALPENSRARQDRYPFYRVFENSEEVLKRLAVDISLEDWAKSFADCERVESQKIFQFFTDRQKFLVRSLLDQLKREPVKVEEKVAAKKMICQMAKAYAEPVYGENEKNHEQAA